MISKETDESYRTKEKGIIFMALFQKTAQTYDKQGNSSCLF